MASSSFLWLILMMKSPTFSFDSMDTNICGAPAICSAHRRGVDPYHSFICNTRERVVHGKRCHTPHLVGKAGLSQPSSLDGVCQTALHGVNARLLIG